MRKRPFQILVVEDAEPDVFLVREALEHSGLSFELHILDDGEKAVDFIDRVDRDESLPRPNILLLDLNLPKNRAVFCHIFAEVCFPSINHFFHFRQLLFVGPDAAAFRTFV